MNDPLFRLTVASAPERTDAEVRDENRRLRILLDSMASSLRMSAAIVEARWDPDSGLQYVFCVPDLDETPAIDRLMVMMSDRGFPWDPAQGIAMHACRNVCARHGLLDEAKAEAEKLAKKAAP